MRNVPHHSYVVNTRVLVQNLQSVHLFSINTVCCERLWHTLIFFVAPVCMVSFTKLCPIYWSWQTYNETLSAVFTSVVILVRCHSILSHRSRLILQVSDEPICIVTELMAHGSLLSYLRTEGKSTYYRDHLYMMIQVRIWQCVGQINLNFLNISFLYDRYRRDGAKIRLTLEFRVRTSIIQRFAFAKQSWWPYPENVLGNYPKLQ